MSEEKKDRKATVAVAEPDAEPREKYRLKEGAKYYDRQPPLYQPKLVAPGTVVELTETQARAFRDLFERA